MSGARYLGVDGGGTKTEFVCIDDAGEVLARAVTGTTYHLEIGVAEVERRLGEGIGAVCALLGIAPAEFDQVFFGLPAYGEDGTVDPELHAACGRRLGHSRYACDNDMVCGWAGSLACEDGINIVAGTGSIGYGERQGLSARVGGWGEVFGDPVVATALLDRLLHHAVVIQIEGASYRLRAHADLIPEHVRANAPITPPPPPKRRGRPPNAKNGAEDH